MATLEEVDNGLGLGQGAIHEEVHVSRPGKALGKHGDEGESVVFYAESTYENGRGVNLRWVADRRLRVEYDSKQNPGRRIEHLGGVDIEYLRRPD